MQQSAEQGNKRDLAKDDQDIEAARAVAAVSAARIRIVIGELYSGQFHILLYLTFIYFLLVTAGDIVSDAEGRATLLVADALLLGMLVAIFFLERIDYINTTNVYLTPIPTAIGMLINGYLHIFMSGDPIMLIKGILMTVAFGIVSLLPWIFWLLVGLATAFFMASTFLMLGAEGRVLYVLGIGAAMISYGGFAMRYNSVRRQIALTLLNEERAQKLETLGKSKDQFIANISHELRTPLTGLLGMVNLIDEDGLRDEQKQQLSAAKSSADTLGIVIRDLLDISTLDAGKLELKLAPFSFEQTAQSVVSVMQGQAKNGVQLTYEMPPDALPILLGDGSRIRQILFNLVGNAVKFTDQGSVTLKVQLRRPIDPERANAPIVLRCMVLDTGVGIAAAKKGRLFDRFEQVDASSTRARAGTGLGLAIAQELAELMDSHIEVSSQEGVGTRFWFDLELEPVPDDVEDAVLPEDAEISESEIQEKLAKPLRILIAEDNPVNQLLISKLLDQPHWKSRLVSDGLSAVQAAAESQFDVILMDIQMPILNGEMATKKIRESKGPNARTPIIALTANCQEQDIIRYREGGFSAHVGKPIRTSNFYASIAGLI